MSRINTNVSSLIAQRTLGAQNKALNKSLERLSTGLAINRGSDNPAGLIASEKLRGEKVAIKAAIGNAERADQIVNIAEGGLQEINNLLTEVQGLVSQSANDAGLSTEEKEANQLQVDAILQTIDRIASTTSFAGTKLLNGGFEFTVSGQASEVANYQINGAKLQPGQNTAVNAIVTNSAEHGSLFVSAAANLDLTSATDRFTFELTGAKGSREFSFASGTSLGDIATAINGFKTVTGVSAVASGSFLELKSSEFGSSEFVSFRLIDDGGQAGRTLFASGGNENQYTTVGAVDFSTAEGSNAIRAEGQDIGAIINGVTARGRGTEASINTDALDLAIEFSATGAQTLSSVSAFTITGGGAKFNLGPTVDAGNQVQLGIGDVAVRKLGSASTGFLSQLGSGKSANLVDGDLNSAQKIVTKAVDQVTGLRGRLGAFQKNIVGSTINALGVALENTTAAESAIRDTDFASETANLTRSQILVQAASVAVAIAKSSPQSALQLLG
jgi:flagellin